MLTCFIFTGSEFVGSASQYSHGTCRMRCDGCQGGRASLPRKHIRQRHLYPCNSVVRNIRDWSTVTTSRSRRKNTRLGACLNFRCNLRLFPKIDFLLQFSMTSPWRHDWYSHSHAIFVYLFITGCTTEGSGFDFRQSKQFFSSAQRPHRPASYRKGSGVPSPGLKQSYRPIALIYLVQRLKMCGAIAPFSNTSSRKGKINIYVHVTPWWRMEEWRYSCTIFDLGTKWRWVVSFTLRPLYPWCLFHRRLCGPHSRLRRRGVKNKLTLPGIKPQTVQPVGCRYTNWATLAPSCLRGVVL
jgi:hypothetical protein